MARHKSGLLTLRVEVRTNRQKPASTRSTHAEVPGTRGRCAGGIPEEYLQLGGAPRVVASAGSKTIEGGPQRLMSLSPKGREQAGTCFARAEESPVFGKHCVTWERSSSAGGTAAERPGVGPERVGPGRTESAPCAQAVEARNGKGLPGQAVLQSPAVAGPITASSHQYLHDDAGAGTIRTVCPVSYNPEVPGYSVSQTEPPFIHHPVSTDFQQLRFQDG